MICLGVDPDLHNTGLALLEYYTDDMNPSVLDLATVSISKDYKQEDAVIKMIAELKSEISTFVALNEIDRCVIEGQQKYFGTSPAKVENLIQLAYVSGAAAAHCWSNNPESICIVLPRIWKGTIPKEIFQERILKTLNWKPKRSKNFSYPKNPPEQFKFSQEKWKHLVDAIGLAWWGIKCLIKEKKYD